MPVRIHVGQKLCRAGECAYFITDGGQQCGQCAQHAGIIVHDIYHGFSCSQMIIHTWYSIVAGRRGYSEPEASAAAFDCIESNGSTVSFYDGATGCKPKSGTVRLGCKEWHEDVLY